MQKTGSLLSRTFHNSGTRTRDSASGEWAFIWAELSVVVNGLPRLRSSFIRLAQLSKIELFHFEERLRQAADLLGVAVAHHLIHLGRNDLP
jgi:hypothetical protein